MQHEPYRLSPEEVGFSIPEEHIQALQEGVQPGTIIGQPRAVEALTLGIQLSGKGYNIFVAGPPGTGRHTAIRRILETLSPPNRWGKDIAYAYNFQNPQTPRVLYFPARTAARFKRALRRTLEKLTKGIRHRLTSESYLRKKTALMREVEAEERRLLEQFQEELRREGFTMLERPGDGQTFTDLVPLWHGQPIEFDELAQKASRGEVPHELVEERRQKYFPLLEKLQDLFATFDLKRLAAEERLAEIQRTHVAPDVRAEIQRLAASFHAEGPLLQHLKEMERDVLDHLAAFLEEDTAGEEDGMPISLRYTIHIMHEVEDPDRAPVVFESQPDYTTLFGTIESIPEKAGEERANFLMIRPGSILKANGGFIILRVEDLLRHEELWATLKRVLLDGRLEIRTPPGPFSAPSALKPEPIQVDVKAILIGNEFQYEYLFLQDEDFGKLFKIPAEFDTTIPLNDQTIREYIGFIRATCERKHLLPVDTSGIAALLEYGVRLGEERDKLTARFSLVTDILREADHWARTMGSDHIDRQVVEAVQRHRNHLFGLLEEKIDEQILSGELLIQLEGTAVGKINGLVILDRGFHSFARPVLITARTAPGTEGIVNIERESGLSGELHDKGVYIIQGYLQSRYARRFPLSIKASIAFEQSYVEIDGDSASLAEMCALLSDIAGIPLRQEIAVTGSINQMGQVQPVGGISEKVEGFFKVCRKKGLTGTQGVIIPRLNLKNLILEKDVQEAVREGLFHIYAVETIDQAMEVLTGMEAGTRTSRGTFAPGTVNERIETRLREMARVVKEFGS
ncbi:peptidase S16 lon domain protein [Spirochaeta thermophila DSM 6578]|uniref:endopeptidase La n=1 Tax=Winmispira thermophila (strain ATCC 700085 / DSM 6578 / Z-1203) TaxID=869211 RepID=G0GC78_WINT7|nr:AAA family ATPase [Spirochaeta thermophila]AEJ60442.1 peptidase S16 lon domain protein [Spirochaeta thermophila DSM 6578]